MLALLPADLSLVTQLNSAQFHLPARRPCRLERELRSKAERLPPEPAADDPDSINLAVRLPAGGRCSRRFRRSDPLQARGAQRGRAMCETCEAVLQHGSVIGVRERCITLECMSRHVTRSMLAPTETYAHHG